MTEFEIASLMARYVIGGGQVLIGLGQIAVVWHFGRQMVRANERRARADDRQEQANELRERDSQRRHEETMVALKAQGQALAALVEGMQTVIARTGEARPS